MNEQLKKENKNEKVWDKANQPTTTRRTTTPTTATPINDNSYYQPATRTATMFKRIKNKLHGDRSVTFKENEMPTRAAQREDEKQNEGSKNDPSAAAAAASSSASNGEASSRNHYTWPSVHASGGGKRRSSGMEVGVASYTSGRPMAGSPDRGRGGPPRTNLHVEFAPIGEVKERKEKYLTAKYGAHQMSLIRKRLNVEMWMFDQLQSLYPAPQEGKHEEKELDLDELLDVEGELKKRKYLWDSLADCKQSKDKVEKFINELLERATTL